MIPTGMNSRDSWLAMILCSLIGLLTMMPTKLYSLLFVEILGRFDANREMACYPIFLATLVIFSGGPLTGYFGERFGLHVVILAGCLLSVLGVGACYLAEDMIAVTIFLGLVYGLGTALSVTLFPQVLKLHFNKNLTFAISMSMFGSCLGGFLFPPLIKWILQSYGVSGAFLIMGGIMLNSLPCAMLLKCLKPKKTLAQVVEKEGKTIGAEAKDTVATSTSTLKSAVNGNTENTEGKKYCVWQLRNNCHNKPPSDLSPRLMNGEEFAHNSTPLNNRRQTDSKLLVKHQSLINDKNALEQTVALLPKCVESTPENSEKKVTVEAKPVCEKPTSKQQAALQSLAIFLDLTYLIILITHSLEVIFQVIVLTTMLDYSHDKGIDRSYEVHFMMALPLAEVFGRVFLSMVIDRDYVTKLNFTIVSYIALALVLLMIVWAKTFTIMMVGVVAFGLITSGILSVFPMLVFQFMEPKNYIMAMASKVSFFGPLILLCAPLIGHFRVTGGSYDWVYYIQAIFSAFCAVLLVFTPHSVRRRDRKREQKREKAKLNSSINA